MGWINEGKAFVLERGNRKVIVRDVGDARPEAVVQLGFGARCYRITLLEKEDEVEVRQACYKTIDDAQEAAEKLLGVVLIEDPIKDKLLDQVQSELATAKTALTRALMRLKNQNGAEFEHYYAQVQQSRDAVESTWAQLKNRKHK